MEDRRPPAWVDSAGPNRQNCRDCDWLRLWDKPQLGTQSQEIVSGAILTETAPITSVAATTRSHCPGTYRETGALEVVLIVIEE